MKPIKLIACIALVTVCLSLRIREFPPTPKASDLTDHFGTEPSKNIYGPIPVVTHRLAREGKTSEATPVSPISNFSSEIDVNRVVAGDLLNTAFDATKIIKPEIAGIYIILIIN